LICSCTRHKQIRLGHSGHHLDHRRPLSVARCDASGARRATAVTVSIADASDAPLASPIGLQWPEILARAPPSILAVSSASQCAISGSLAASIGHGFTYCPQWLALLHEHAHRFGRRRQARRGSLPAHGRLFFNQVVDSTSCAVHKYSLCVDLNFGSRGIRRVIGGGGGVYSGSRAASTRPLVVPTGPFRASMATRTRFGAEGIFRVTRIISPDRAEHL
jgi:hypothetical protein